MKKPSEAYTKFRGIVKGWAFCNEKMLRGKINAAQQDILKIRRESEFMEASDTLNAMRNALAKMKDK